MVAARGTQLAEEFFDVFHVIETIREDSSALVHPEPHQFGFATVHKRFHHLQPEYYTRYVSQIEQVVGFGRRGPQILSSVIEDVN